VSDAYELAALLSDLPPQSAAALAHAMAVAKIDGVAGTLIIKIPSATARKFDVSFVTGKARLDLET
jgi:hypothetical protein